MNVFVNRYLSIVLKKYFSRSIRIFYITDIERQLTIKELRAGFTVKLKVNLTDV